MERLCGEWPVMASGQGTELCTEAGRSYRYEVALMHYTLLIKSRAILQTKLLA